MKFCQLIEYNMRNTFIEKTYRKYGGKASPDPFLENWNWAYLWINSLKFYTVFFNRIPSWGLSKCIETKHLICFNLILSLPKEIIGGLELVSLPYFLQIFWRKIFLLLYLINWPNFMFWLLLIRKILGNIYIAIVC